MNHKIELKLPLTYVHELKRGKDKKIAYSLNGYLAKLSGNKKKARDSGYYQYIAKQALIEEARTQLDEIKPFPDNTKYPLTGILQIHKENKKIFDLDNTIIMVKFALDTIKERHIPEDNYKYVERIILENSSLDPENPHGNFTLTSNYKTEYEKKLEKDNKKLRATVRKMKKMLEN